jgi:hypothetical protein
MPTFQEWLVRRPKTTYGLISNALERPIGVSEPSSEVLREPSAFTAITRVQIPSGTPIKSKV